MSPAVNSNLPLPSDRPEPLLALTPMKSVIIGIVAAVLVGAVVITLLLWLPCRAARKRRKALAAAAAAARAAAAAAEGGSPGPSVKSLGNKEPDGNESDEKNPDIIPDTMESDDQVRFFFWFCFRSLSTQPT